MPPLNFISSGRSVRKRLPLEKFVDYTHCCESSISLEGGCSKDRLRLCRLFTSFQESGVLNHIIQQIAKSMSNTGLECNKYYY